MTHKFSLPRDDKKHMKLWPLLIFFVTFSALAEEDQPCYDWRPLFETPLSPQDLAERITQGLKILDGRDEPLAFSFDSVEIEEDLIRFTAPRFNRLALSTHEQFCLEVAIPRWHPVPRCVRSEFRETIISFCESLGLRPAENDGQYLYDSELVSTRRHRRAYVQYMNKWEIWDVRTIGPHFNHPIITSVSCRL